MLTCARTADALHDAWHGMHCFDVIRCAFRLFRLRLIGLKVQLSDDRENWTPQQVVIDADVERNMLLAELQVSLPSTGLHLSHVNVFGSGWSDCTILHHAINAPWHTLAAMCPAKHKMQGARGERRGFCSRPIKVRVRVQLSRLTSNDLITILHHATTASLTAPCYYDAPLHCSICITSLQQLHHAAPYCESLSGWLRSTTVLL